MTWFLAVSRFRLEGVEGSGSCEIWVFRVWGEGCSFHKAAARYCRAYIRVQAANSEMLPKILTYIAILNP